MSDDNKTITSLGAFLTKFSAPIVGIIAFISNLNGFIKLFAEKDAGLITIISLIVGILLLFGICLYYARFWKPEKQDKSISGFPLTLTNEQVQAQATKETGRKRVRRAAVAGLVLVPLLTFAGIGGWQYVQTLPTKDVIILVADFEGPDPQSYRVTETIRKNLENATEPYADTKVKLLGKVIKDTPEQSGRDVAREEGKQRKAAIVIWGWYGKTKDTVPISVNFEILKPPEDLPELGKDMKGQVQTAPIAELESFKVQTRLSNQMAYLTLMTLGLSRLAANDWDGTIDRLSNALEQVKGDDHFNLGQDAVYVYRAYSHSAKGDYAHAIADYSQALKLKSNNAYAYSGRGYAYIRKGDYEHAIADYTQALKLKSDDADAYNNRGSAYREEHDYNKAIADYTQALKLKPDYPEAYYNRGGAYGEKHDYDKAITDFTQALKLKPDHVKAYINRGTTYNGKGDYERAITDFNQALKLNPNYSDAYNGRGTAYGERKNYELAIADLNQALKLEPSFAEAYDSRGTVYRYKGDLDRALSDYNQALKLNPDLAESHLWRGVIYSQRGEKQKAMDDLNAALTRLDDPTLKQRAEEELRKLK